MPLATRTRSEPCSASSVKAADRSDSLGNDTADAPELRATTRTRSPSSVVSSGVVVLSSRVIDMACSRRGRNLRVVDVPAAQLQVALPAEMRRINPGRLVWEERARIAHRAVVVLRIVIRPRAPTGVFPVLQPKIVTHFV